MKLSSRTMIVLMSLSSLILFIQPTQSTFAPMPGLASHVCSLTPHYHLCLITLKSTAFATRVATNPDVQALARMILEVIIKQLPVIVESLSQASGQAQSPQVKIALNSCMTDYTKMAKEIMPQALTSVDKGDLKGVKQNALVAGNLASSCEKKCNSSGAVSGSAALSLKESNQYVQQMCAIAVSIVTKMAQSQHQAVPAQKGT